MHDGLVIVLLSCFCLQSSENGTSGDILLKQAQKDEPKIIAIDSYKDRASIGPDSSLLISQAALDDQRVFTCMVVSMYNLKEYPVEVEVHSEYSFLVIINPPLAHAYEIFSPSFLHYSMYTAHVVLRSKHFSPMSTADSKVPLKF